MQSEDCLFLNVYAPRTAVFGSGKLPVMVFLPGGRFEQSTGQTELYDARYMVNTTGVVVVELNYRLGVFGFLATETGLSGNYGFLDQIFGLEWVQKNIAEFGGDRTRVTLFGQSAGGTSTAVHLSSPVSDPLFHQAIVQSNPWTLHIKSKDEANKIGRHFSKDVGCRDGAEISCLRSKSASAVLAAMIKAGGELNLLNPLFSFYPWTPVVDNVNVMGQPLELFASGKGPQTQKNVIMGTVKDEGVIFIYQAVTKNLTEGDYKLLLDGVFHIHGPAVYAHYPDSGEGAPDARNALSNLATDYIMYCSERHALRAQAAANGGRAWQYVFTHVAAAGQVIWGPDYKFCWDKCCHGEGLPFIFESGNVILPGLMTPPEANLASQMAQYWGNFAWSGDPNVGPGKGLPNWPAYQEMSDESMIFDIPLTTQAGVRSANCDFFDKIGYGW